MNQNSSSGNRIAKNTLFLYVRTIFVLFVSLYTSRVVLDCLGVDDFGIYNVVGGIVATLTVISSSLSMSISRFITYELGTGNELNLNQVFCTSVNIQLIFSAVVVLLMEILGVWFLNSYLSIPEDRMVAANWVLQFSIIVFIINLISVPYNALIIAHEKMSAFAYISIVEVSLKLMVAYFITVSHYDKLIIYAFLLVVVAFIIRMIYATYCSRKFEECRYHIVIDKSMMNRMFGFAGWSFAPNIIWVLNNQGISFLMNIFFGVVANASRGVASQVETAIKKFVTDFTTAINPQITKRYASGDITAMYDLVCQGSKLTFFMFLLFTLPVFLETPTIMRLWLKTVPEYAVLFFRLSLIITIIDLLGNSMFIAIQASGKIKRYMIMESSLGAFVFPITWLIYKNGGPIECCYYVFIFLYSCIYFVRIIMTRYTTGMKIQLVFHRVLFRIFPVCILSIIAPYIVHSYLETSILRLILVFIVSSFFCSIFILAIGLDSRERAFIKEKALSQFRII